MRRSRTADFWRSGQNRWAMLGGDEAYYKRCCKKFISKEKYEELMQFVQEFYDDQCCRTFRKLVKEFPQVLIDMCDGPKDIQGDCGLTLSKPNPTV